MKFLGRFSILILLILVGCNYTKIKGPTDGDNSKFDLPPEKISSLSYDLIFQKVLSTRCVSCHGNSGSINLESYAETIRNIALIEKVVFQEKTMPKKGSLSPEELAYLWNWIRIGAPEQAQGGDLAPPVEAPEAIVPTYTSINKLVFQKSCVDCHNPTGSGKRVPLDKDFLLNSPLELVLPNNSDESGLVIAVERADSKRMPPAKEGYSALSNEAKEAIRKWIDNGAKD